MADNTPATPVWFVTGCSTGFGRDLAQVLLADGHRAVVTARNPAQVADIVADHPETGLALPLDVTDPSAVATAVERAEERFGRIDVLVNNAGYGYLCAAEEGEDAEVRAMFETNFFGLVTMTKAVLPGMRARGRGHVLNISSVGGLVGNPGSGYYAATKFAVEGFSEALSKEVAPLGLKVTLIEPGPFRTDWAGRSLKTTRRPIEAYDATVRTRLADLAKLSGNQPGDPVRAARAMMDVVASAEPPLHLVLGAPGLKLVRTKLDALENDLRTWEATTLGTDYPGSQAA